MIEPIVLIGPLKTGKTTIERLLSAKLDMPFISLDKLERDYIRLVGFDDVQAEQIQTARGDFEWYSYRRQFFDEAVVRFLAKYKQGILELGGGHPILPTEEQQRRVEAMLAPIRNTVLLMPTPNLEESRQILKLRQKPERLHPDLNDIFLADNRFFRIAKHVIYTLNKSPEQVVDEVAQAVI